MRLLEEGYFAYSSLSAGRDNTASEGWIFLQYESEQGCHVARFNLSWMLEGELTGDGTLPDGIK